MSAENRQGENNILQISNQRFLAKRLVGKYNRRIRPGFGLKQIRLSRYLDASRDLARICEWETQKANSKSLHTTIGGRIGCASRIVLGREARF